MTCAGSVCLNLPPHNIEPYSKGYWDDIISRVNLVENDFSLEAAENFILQNIEESSKRKRANEPMGAEKTKENEYEKYLALARSITASSTPSLEGLNKVAEERTALYNIDFEGAMHVAFQLLKDSSKVLTDNVPLLMQERDGVVKLTRRQVASLLSHMLCCTLVPMSHNKYWVSFEPWLIRDSGPSLAYLLTLLHYFQEFDKWDDNYKDESVKFHRTVLTPEKTVNWSLCDKPIVKVDVRHGNSIGDREGEVEVDFANKDVGFGVTGTQEELLFGMSPELCVAVLISSTLKDDEAFVMEGLY